VLKKAVGFAQEVLQLFQAELFEKFLNQPNRPVFNLSSSSEYLEKTYREYVTDLRYYIRITPASPNPTAEALESLRDKEYNPQLMWRPRPAFFTEHAKRVAVDKAVEEYYQFQKGKISHPKYFSLRPLSANTTDPFLWLFGHHQCRFWRSRFEQTLLKRKPFQGSKREQAQKIFREAKEVADKALTKATKEFRTFHADIVNQCSKTGLQIYLGLESKREREMLQRLASRRHPINTDVLYQAALSEYSEKLKSLPVPPSP
jgi:hypothetical protein